MSIFFTADLHAGHENIIKYEREYFSGLEEMHEYIVQEWNKQIGKKDTVYILGDFYLGKKEEAEKFVGRLHGAKNLIRGNHDRWAKKGEVKGFGWIKDVYQLKYDNIKFFLSHYPHISWPSSAHNQKEVNSVMLHGHCHGNLDYPRKDLLIMDVGMDTRESKSSNYLYHIEEVIEIIKNKLASSRNFI